MTGCVFQRGDIYYIRLKYQDFTGKLKEKWVSTGLRGRGAKRQAQQMIDQIRILHTDQPKNRRTCRVDNRP